MPARAATPADYPKMVTLWNANLASMRLVFPSIPVNTVTLAGMAAMFEKPGAINVVFFQGTTLQGHYCSHSKDAVGEPGVAWMWHWLVLSSLTDSAFRSVTVAMILEWWRLFELQGGVKAVAYHPLVYPNRVEALFQKMITAGTMVVSTQTWKDESNAVFGYRIVETPVSAWRTIRDALAVIP